MPPPIDAPQSRERRGGKASPEQRRVAAEKRSEAAFEKRLSAAVAESPVVSRAKSVEMVEHQLAEQFADAKAEAAFGETLTASIQETRTAPRTMSPQARLGWLGKALDELGLPSSCLASARRLAESVSQLARREQERVQEAQQARQHALKGLVRDPSGSLDVAAAAYLAQSPWLDVPYGSERPPAVGLVRDARRLLEGQVDAQVVAAGPIIFPLVKAKAAEVVGEVAELPPIPEGVWTLLDAAHELSKYRQHRASWGSLIAAAQEFNLCHSIADLYRDHLGLSSDQLDGAPPWALVYRNWHQVFADLTWSSVRKELRLPYAIQHGFEPGLWEPSEVVVTAEDRTFGSRLRTFGQALLGSPAA